MAANPLLEAGVEAVEIESVIPLIPSLIPKDNSLYSFAKDNFQVVPVSNATAGGGVIRPSMRVPFRPQAGGAIAQGTGNADSLGRGTMGQYAAFALSPIFYFGVSEVSHLAELAMEGRKRGLFNLQAQEIKYSFDSFMEGLESLMQGDSTGTLDTIPSTATVNNNTGSGQSASSIVGLNNAFQFQDQQTIQVFSSGGALRGSFVVSYTDPVAQTIYSAGALPAGTTTTDVLVVSGATGVAGSSILGVRAWQITGNSGTVAGISRASFPGRLSTPSVNLNGAALNPTHAWRAIHNLMLAMGGKAESVNKAIWYCGPDQARQMGNLTLNVQFVQALEATGDTNPDIVSKMWNKTFGQRKVIVGMHALPGRLDLINPSTWRIGELVAPRLYDFGGGNTIMPVPDIVNGSYLTSTMFAYEGALNIANAAPRFGFFYSNAAILSP